MRVSPSFSYTLLINFNRSICLQEEPVFFWEVRFLQQVLEEVKVGFKVFDLDQ